MNISKKIIKFFVLPIIIAVLSGVILDFILTDQQEKSKLNRKTTLISENHKIKEGNNVSSNSRKTNSYSKEHSTDKISHANFKQATATKKEHQNSIPTPALICSGTIDDPLDCPL